MAMIECTTGVIDSDDKLAKLLSRFIAMKDRLSNSGSAHVELLPVLITALPAVEVMDIDKATKFGIAVLTRESLAATLEQSVVPLDPDAMFRQQVEMLRKT